MHAPTYLRSQCGNPGAPNVASLTLYIHNSTTPPAASFYASAFNLTTYALSGTMINSQRSYTHPGAGNDFSVAGCHASTLFYTAGAWVVGDPTSINSNNRLPCSATPLFVLYGPAGLSVSESAGFASVGGFWATCATASATATGTDDTF